MFQVSLLSFEGHYETLVFAQYFVRYPLAWDRADHVYSKKEMNYLK